MTALESLVQEFRSAVRTSWKRLGNSIIAMVMMALGLGLSTVMFSFVYSSMFRELPVPVGDRIIHLEEIRPGARPNLFPFSNHDLRDLERSQTSFDALAGYRLGTVNLAVSDRPYRVMGAYVTAEVLDLLDVSPRLGRIFLPEDADPGAALTVVLGFRRWTAQFGGDPSVVGMTTRVNGEDATIIGVMPEGFRFPFDQDLWVPDRVDLHAVGRSGGPRYDIVGRLREDVTRAQAQEELDAIAVRLEELDPESNRDRAFRVVPFTKVMTPPGSETLDLSMLAVAVLVLLIVCMNVANLLLGRAASRAKELGIRAALGASRSRLITHLIGEAGVLALCGGLAGAVIAQVGLGLLEKALDWTAMPFWWRFSVDAPILLSLLFMILLVAIGSGGIPALRVARMMGRGSELWDGARTTSSLSPGTLGRWLVAGQLAASVALLVPTGMMTKGIVQLRGLDYGFDSENVLTARIGLVNSNFPDAESRRLFTRRMIDRLAERPEYSSVAVATAPPGRRSATQGIQLEGVQNPLEGEAPRTSFISVSPSLFDVVGVEVVRGRGFRDSDGPDDPPVAIVNESFVRRFLSGQDPIGRRFRSAGSTEDEPWLTVVGVVPDLWMGGVDNQDQPPDGFYRPYTQANSRFFWILARVPGDPSALVGTLRGEVAALDPESPLFDIQSLADALRADLNLQYTMGGFFGVFGVVSLLLAALGLYGSVEFATGRRTREIGVRVALGAGPLRVIRMVIGQTSRHVALGVLAGLGLGELGSRSLGLFIAQEQPWDLSVHLGIVLVLSAATLTASFVPALKATRVPPTEALRWE